MPGKKHGRGTARGRGTAKKDTGQEEPQRPGQGPEMGGAAAPAPAPQPAVPQQQGHPLGAWARPPQQQGVPQGHRQGAWAQGQPPTAWGQGQPQSAQGQGPPQGQPRPALGQGPPQGQPRPALGQGPPQGQPRPAWGQGPPQGQPQPAWSQGPRQGQPQPARVQGPPQGQPQPAWGQGPPQRQPQTARAQPPPQRGPPESHEPQQAGDQAASTLPGGGRTVRRGVTRTQEGRAGDASVEEVARGLEEVAIEQRGAVGGGDAPRRQRRNPYEDFICYRERVDKEGKSGKPIKVRGNYFRMSVPTDLKLYQYHVDFSPVCDSKKMKWKLLSHHDIGAVRVFDGTALYLTEKLPSNEQVFHTRRFIDDANVKITIRFICEVVSISPSTLQFLNIVWRRILSMMDLKQIKRHFFDMTKAASVSRHGLEVYSGFQSSILQYEDDVLLDIDIAHKVLRSKSVLDIIEEMSKALQHMSVDDCRARIGKEIVGQVVFAKYSNKTFLIYDIYWEGRVTDTFERITEKETTTTTYIKYYESNYNRTITEMNQPLLVTRGIRRVDKHGNLEDCNIFLVPELLFPTGLTEANKTDFGLKKDLATHTKLNPETRVNRLTNFMRNLKGNEMATKEIKNWRLGFEDNLVLINARRLDPEEVTMWNASKPGEVEYSLRYDNADWGKAIQGARMKLGVDMRNWLLVHSQNTRRNVRKLIEHLQKVGPPLGMRIADPKVVCTDSDRAESYLRALQNNLRQGETQMAVCILPNNRKDRYDTIKKHCCLRFPVASQVVLDKTLSADHRLMSVATKIAIQMNCKLGGVIWTLKIPLKSTMIIGIDTYHDSSRKDRSAVGVVATINSDFTRYKSTVGFQLRHQELGDQLQSCVVACLHAYKAEHSSHALPEKVIVFRDGVGDGQLQLCLEHEVSQIKRAFGNQSIQLAFIVVKKRINARFFQENEPGAAGGRGGPRGGPRGRVTYSNPEPGTVVDTVATKPAWYDFYLISQTVREGTVSPTHYNLLLNELTLTPDHFQRLAYKMTHMYYNWQGTIRVPAPCMYAHKLAFLVGQSLHEEPHGPLTNHLYYL